MKGTLAELISVNALTQLARLSASNEVKNHWVMLSNSAIILKMEIIEIVL